MEGKERKGMDTNIYPGYIEGFSRERFESWLNKADSIEAKDVSDSKYLDCFIFAWVAFNHYYASWWYNRHRKDNERFGDERAWKECIDKDDLIKDIYSNIKSKEKLKLNLPVEGGRRNAKPVPHGKPLGAYVCDELNLLEFFQVCYRVRNNLIHGTKDFDKSRDQECTKFTYKNLALFLKELQKTLK